MKTDSFSLLARADSLTAASLLPCWSLAAVLRTSKVGSKAIALCSRLFTPRLSRPCTTIEWVVVLWWMLRLWERRFGLLCGEDDLNLSELIPSSHADEDRRTRTQVTALSSLIKRACLTASSAHGSAICTDIPPFTDRTFSVRAIRETVETLDLHTLQRSSPVSSTPKSVFMIMATW